MENKMKYKVINNYEFIVEKIFDSEEEAYAYIESKHPLLDDKYSVEEINNENCFGKAIMLSVQPKWVSKILNGEKTIEIRKKFPKNYVGWVYIYCTKGKPYLYESEWDTSCCSQPEKGIEYCKGTLQNHISTTILHGTQWGNVLEKRTYKNGKVVARFWCDKVEELFTDEDGWSYYTDTITKDYEVSKLACIDDSEIEEYLNGKIGYAIHITELEIFDEPKKISEFSCPHYNAKYNKWNELPFEHCFRCPHLYSESNMDGDHTDWCWRLDSGKHCLHPLKNPPQSWCYIEV